MRNALPLAVLLLLATGVSSMTGCFKPYKSPVRAEAYVPVYGYDPTLRTITASEPKPTTDAGKVYVVGKKLYQVENNAGIHIMDYTDEKNPKKLGFLNITGCAEVSVKNNVLFTNCMDDVVSIDISDISHPKELNRVQKAFKTQYYNVISVIQQPPYPNVYFKCPDGFSGDVVGWKLEKNVEFADCRTN